MVILTLIEVRLLNLEALKSNNLMKDKLQTRKSLINLVQSFLAKLEHLKQRIEFSTPPINQATE